MPDGALDEARRRVLQATASAQTSPAGRWTILDGYLKPFAAVRHTHYGVEAALRLRQSPEFALERINAIKLSIYPEAVQYCGNRAPRTAIQAQFSLSYAIAAALALGDLGPDAYRDVGDATLTRLEQLVSIESDRSRTRRSATLTIEIGGTTLLESVDDVAGDASLPMTREQVTGKFLRYAEPAVGRRGAEALIAFMLDSDQNEPVRRWFSAAH
jgi:2-methylcitrate dehydratase PrpD